MSYQVLARKYRPKSFDTLVGQDHVVRALTNALTQNRLHHAYLFTGTRGCGKTTLARILAKSLNCEKGVSATPCGVCNACTEIDRGRFVDLLEVDAASNTQVDAMRDLLDNAQYAPTVGRFKVYIIDEVHMLSKSAFNAMLKTLEEPPAHVKFILATTDPQKVPVTVLSRCLQFNLRQMASPTISAHLQNVLQQEQIAYEPTAIGLISRAAAGSMRDALSLTDQAIAYGNQTVNEAEVRSMLGAIDQSYLFDILTALQANNGEAIVQIATQMASRSIAFEAALNDLANVLHQIAVAQTVPNSLADDLPERAALLRFAQQLSAETIQLYYQIALLGRRDIGLAPDEYAGFTMTLLRMLAFSPSEKLQSNASHQPPTGQAEKSSASSNAPSAAREASAIAALTAATQSSSEQTANTVAHAPQNANVDKAPVAQDRIAHEVTNDSANVTTHASTQASAKPEISPALQTNIHAPSSGVLFDGNWRKLVEQNLKLGLARSLAQNCEMMAYDEHSITLRVAENNKHLASPTYQDKLSSAIQEFFGRKIRLHFEIGAGEINTPAKQMAVEKATVQSSAEAAIMQDGFVQALVNDFGATIIPNSIKPLQ
jgi:DNA polymerase III subunit gamma/tau